MSKVKVLLIVALAVLPAVLAAPAVADVAITQKSTSTMMGGMMLTSGSFIMYISGDRQRTDMEMKSEMPMFASPVMKSTTITCLDKGLVWNIDHERKMYQEILLADLRAMVDSFSVDDESTPGPLTDDMEIGKPEFSIKPTGRTRTINSFACEEILVHMIMHAADRQTGDTGSFVLHNDMWVTKNCPGWEEYRNFSKKSMEKMGGTEDQGSPVAALSMMGFDLQGLMKEMEKIEGMPILQEMTMVLTGDLGAHIAEQMAEREEAMGQAAAAMQGLAGMAGREDKDAKKTDSGTESGLIFESAIEVESIKSGAVEAAKFEVPQGYSKSGY
jgi:hypothetical protein